MSLLDYVSNIGRKICGLLSDVDILQSNVADLQIQINNTTGNIVALETGKADKNQR